MKKILIAGANSYIGTSVEAYLKKWPQQYSIDTVDMMDANWRDKSFAGYDSVFHVAGIAHIDTRKVSETEEQLYKSVNTDLAIECARKAHDEGVGQFIFMSSAIIYGDSAPFGKIKLITRETEPAPSNCYSYSKLNAEHGIEQFIDDTFKVCILRPPMVYGKGSKGNYPILAKLAGRLPIFPNVNNTRSMLYIENLCEFVKLMLDNDEQGVFWPQNSEYSNTTELVREIAEAHGRKIYITGMFNWVLYLLRPFSRLVDKAFGSLVYDQALSQYKTEYRLIDLQESIKRTET